MQTFPRSLLYHLGHQLHRILRTIRKGGRLPLLGHRGGEVLVQVHFLLPREELDPENVVLLAVCVCERLNEWVGVNECVTECERKCVWLYGCMRGESVGA